MLEHLGWDAQDLVPQKGINIHAGFQGGDLRRRMDIGFARIVPEAFVPRNLVHCYWAMISQKPIVKNTKLRFLQAKSAMGTKTNKLQYFIVWLPVNQHQGKLDMAITVVFPLVGQRMVAVTFQQRQICGQ